MSLSPELYDRCYKLHLPHRKCRVDQNISNLTLGENEIILDVGCGPGHFTLDFILPTFKSRLKHIVAIDINKSMLNLAREKYSHPQIYYKELDFSKPVTEKVKIDLLLNDVTSDGFDRIVSFFCLMDIKDQRVVSRNIYELLKPGGEAFLVLPGKNFRDEIVLGISKMSKWAKYTQMVEDHLSFYHYSENPTQEMQQYFKEAGLDVVYCREDESVDAYENVQDFQDLICSTATFLSKIPPEMKEEYLIEAMDIIKRLNGRYECRMTTLTALVRKPAV